MAKLRNNTAKIWKKGHAVGILLLLAILLAGCSGIGPKTVTRDRLEYVSAISDSWKRQALLNLLKTRYMDAPIFLEIASVINQYSVEQDFALGVSAELYNKGDPSFISPEIGATRKYTDRPTITYNPLMGEQFARSLLKPIPLSGILLLLQSGYPVDYVLRICVQTINGLKNRRSGELVGREPETKFFELLALLRHLQAAGGMEINFRTIDNKETAVMFFRPPEGEAVSGNLNRIKRLLGLDPDVREFRVVHGSFAEDGKTIALLTRSMIQVMGEYASYIEVPDSDVSEGRVFASQQVGIEKEAQFPPLIRVRNGTSKPEGAFVAVAYRDRWFWIDDRDTHSKGTFYFLMILFSFTERGVAGQAAPIVTIPTN